MSLWSRFRVPISGTFGFVMGATTNKLWNCYNTKEDAEEKEAPNVAVWRLERFPHGSGDGTYRLYHNNQKTDFVYRANLNSNIHVPPTIFLDPKQIVQQQSQIYIESILSTQLYSVKANRFE
jgi:hypothetical protein